MESIHRFTRGPECYSGDRCHPSSLRNHSKFIVSYLVVSALGTWSCIRTALYMIGCCRSVILDLPLTLQWSGRPQMQIKTTHLFVLFVVLHTMQVAFFFPNSQPFALFCSFLKIIWDVQLLLTFPHVAVFQALLATAHPSCNQIGCR